MRKRRMQIDPNPVTAAGWEERVEKEQKNTFDLKLALDDMRARQQALVTLILATDQKALALYRLYVTIALASLAGAFGSFEGVAGIHALAGWVLLPAAAVLAIGCWCCSRVIAKAEISLPGRGADFWAWVQRTAATPEEILKAYTDALGPNQDETRAVNAQATEWLSRAVTAGILAPVIGAIFGLAAMQT